MPILSHAEVTQIGKGIFNMLLADMIQEFPSIDKAILKLKAKEWTDFVDAQEKETIEILLRKFGCSD